MSIIIFNYIFLKYKHITKSLKKLQILIFIKSNTIYFNYYKEKQYFTNNNYQILLKLKEIRNQYLNSILKYFMIFSF